MTADIDELIKMLEEKLQEKESAKAAPKPTFDSTKRFIETNGLVKGPDRIPNDVIFYTYMKKYTPKMGEERWSKVHFFRLFNKYFDQARVGKQRYYLLDGTAFDTTREGRIEAESYNKEYHYQIGLKTGKIKRRRRRKAFKADETG
jgi:hypothetical protein